MNKVLFIWQRAMQDQQVKLECFVISGPGATNAVTGLTDALMDSIPILCLTGQVPTHLIGTDAFQEADTVGITRSCTKHNYLVKDVALVQESILEGHIIASLEDQALLL